MYMKPMPSPNGTNHEKLIRVRVMSDAEARDYGRRYAERWLANKGRFAFDGDEMKDSGDAVSEIVDWCFKNLSSEEISRLTDQLGSMGLDTRRRPRGVAADDAAMRKSFNERFPEIARLK